MVAQLQIALLVLLGLAGACGYLSGGIEFGNVKARRRFTVATALLSIVWGGWSSTSMIRHLTIALALAAVSPIGAAGAQLIGPPIPPQLQFDAQPKPQTQLPPAYVPPVGDSATTYSTPLIPLPAQGDSRGRAAECQHQAAIERVPRRERSAYVHNCMMN
jgi:hypothetical protein